MHPCACNKQTWHRIEPSRNFGLVLPTDILWDKLLGVRTVMLSDGDATIDANKCK